MLEKREIEVLNILLFFVLLLSIINVWPSELTGKFHGEDIEPRCVLDSQGDSREIPINSCCFDAKEMSECVEKNSSMVCYNSPERNLTLNRDAIKYCEEEGVTIG